MAALVDIKKEIFRAYDVRGVVDHTLTEQATKQLGQALGSKVLLSGEKSLLVGRDGRLSGKRLLNIFAQGVLSTGCDVIDIGEVPTPVLYFATHELQVPSGVMITGSHNPKEYNGFKILLGGQALYGDQILSLYHQIQQADFQQGHGQLIEQPILDLYLEKISSDLPKLTARQLKIVVDCGNGVAGRLAPELFQRLGCDVVPLFCEVNGHFPNHHPDPGQPDNLQDLIHSVEQHKADLGFAFDGDGDRLGVIDNTGKIIWPDRVLMLFARSLLAQHPGAGVIFDIKSSQQLFKVVQEAGGVPMLSPTGHSLIKAKMRETGALLAGEMSGHFFIKDRWYGFDDAFYAGARLLEILFAEHQASAAEQFAQLPENVSTPEITIAIGEDRKFAVIEKLKKTNPFVSAKVTTVDGIRVDFEDGWGLVRASNTSAFLVLRFEATTKTRLQQIQQAFKAWLEQVDPNLAMPF